MSETKKVKTACEFYKHPLTGEHHIKFLIPGDPTFAPDFLADEHYQNKYPEQWDRYIKNEDQLEGQTRLNEVAWIDEAARNVLHGLSVQTIEQLANVPDGRLGAIGMGARDLRNKAVQHVKDAEDLVKFRQAMAATEQAKPKARAARAAA